MHPNLNIAFLIPSLERGGAERQLLILAEELSRTHKNILLIVMRKTDGYAPVGVRIVYLGKDNRFLFVMRLIRVLRENNVDLLCSFLSGPQIYSLICKVFYWRLRLVLSVRDSDPVSTQYAWIVRFQFLANLFVFNSQKGLAVKGSRIPSFKKQVISNGIPAMPELSKEIVRREVLKTLNLPTDTFLVGTVANTTPHKDYPNLLLAAKQVICMNPKVHFLVIGKSVPPYNLKDNARILNISAKNLSFLGEISDVRKYYHAFDIYCSASKSEGFPNTVCEAMSAGVTCVVTDAGDSSYIVGSTGTIVPKENPEALAEAILSFSMMSRNELLRMGSAAKDRILRNFSVQAMVDNYEMAFNRVSQINLL